MTGKTQLLGMLFMACLASWAMLSILEKLRVIPMFLEEKAFRHGGDEGLDQ